MNKGLVNALALELILINMDPSAAKAFAEKFVTENEDLLVTQVVVQPQQVERRPGGPTVVTGVVSTKAQELVVEGDPDNIQRAVVHRVPVVGADGLTDAQRNAVASGVGLCPNCQQPKNKHLPGCARASGYDPKARTKDPLPPVQ